MREPPSRPRSVFIDEHLRIYEGEQAAALLQEKAGGEAVDPQQGVARVERARWEEAQRYERRTWLERGRGVTSDRNEDHAERFAHYAPLRGRAFARAIELGCGPFTNMRLILEQCTVQEVQLLDPLIEEYLKHPYCRYRGGRLGGLLRGAPTLRDVRHPLRFLRNRRNAQRIGGLWGRRVILVNSMIEAYQTSSRFDLVAMINVLEHCQDAQRVLNKILELLLPGGVLVYADRLYEAEEVERLASVLYDAGHPLRVERAVVEGFLSAHFTPLMRAEYFSAEAFRRVPLRNHELYYIGQRREG